MTDDRIKELASRWRLYPTDHAWDEVLGFAHDLLAAEREWVGLTDEVIRSICDCVPDYDISTYDLIQFARAIEIKLKEKNT